MTRTVATISVTRQRFATNFDQFRCGRSFARQMLTTGDQVVGMGENAKNGIRKYRKLKDINISELARRVGTNRQQMGRLERSTRRLSKEWAERIAPHLGVMPHQLIFPNLADIDVSRFQNVFEIARGGGELPPEPSISIRQDLLDHLLPGASQRSLQLVLVDTDDMAKHIAKGDPVILDLDAKTPTKPGVYALRIAGELQWRFLSPTTAGTILVRSDNPNIPEETANPGDLSIVGRARLKISTV